MEQKIRLGRYRHFKGKEYRVLHLAKHSETMEPMVVYQALYGERGVWVRPARMWNETVLDNGVQTPRFSYIGDADGNPTPESAPERRTAPAPSQKEAF